MSDGNLAGLPARRILRVHQPGTPLRDGYSDIVLVDLFEAARSKRAGDLKSSAKHALGRQIEYPLRTFTSSRSKPMNAEFRAEPRNATLRLS